MRDSRDAAVIGTVNTDCHFHMEFADAGFFHYFGDDVIYSILRIVHEADTERLLQTAQLLRDGQSEQMVLRMRGCNADFRWMLVGLTAHGSGDTRQYQLRISDAFTMERSLMKAISENTEYRFYLNLMRDLAFRYSFRTKHIEIMTFDCCREVILTDMPLTQWRDNAIGQGMVEPHERAKFEKLCADIEAGTSRFQHELETSVCSMGQRNEYCAFRGVTRSQSPGNRTVLGIVTFLHAKYKSKEPAWMLETTRDSATDLMGKAAVTAYAKSILAAQPTATVSLVLLTIDDFKDINDRFGQMFGDEVLFTLSHILKTEIGARGVAGRIGGGMFLLVLEQIADETDLRGILRAIRTKLEWAWEDPGSEHSRPRVTCSMGAACYPIDAQDYDTLFMQADKALFIAREKGHNRYVIYDVNKHGAVVPNRERSAADLYAVPPPRSKAGFIAELAQSLIQSPPDLQTVLGRIGELFAIDGIHIFTAPDWKACYRWGHPVDSDAAVLNGSELQYQEDGVCVIDNINALEGIADDAYRWFSQENMLGAVLIRTQGTVPALIAFGLFGRFRKWSTHDIGYLTILGGILSALFDRKAPTKPSPLHHNEKAVK